jgi:glutathione synthase
VNVTSPTGIREIDRLDDIRLGQQVIEWVVRTRQASNKAVTKTLA